MRSQNHTRQNTLINKKGVKRQLIELWCLRHDILWNYEAQQVSLPNHTVATWDSLSKHRSIISYGPARHRHPQSDNNILQIVVWESIFFNHGVACVDMTRLWAVSVNGWLLRTYDFHGFQALPARRFGVAVTVQSRRRYGVIAMPLRCNRVAVTV